MDTFMRNGQVIVNDDKVEIYMGIHEVFVFGSNLAGVHGAGAAKAAFRHFGAKWGAGYGHYGQSFALPTKGYQLETLNLKTIERYVNSFLGYAVNTPGKIFILTAIGCGLAGYTPKEITSLFLASERRPKNIRFPNLFTPFIANHWEKKNGYQTGP